MHLGVVNVMLAGQRIIAAFQSVMVILQTIVCLALAKDVVFNLTYVTAMKSTQAAAVNF